jgi:chromate reductase
MAKKVAVLIGSLRKESLNRKMAHALIECAPQDLTLEIIEIGDLALYNQDLDDEKRPPESWQRFREKLKPFEAVLFVTPEYNRSVPGVLKNALDVGSRPYGQSVWDRKAGAVVSVSPGAIGGFGANHHLRQSLVFLNVLAMQQPEAYIGGADKIFTADGKLSSDHTREFAQKIMKSFSNWIVQVTGPSQR